MGTSNSATPFNLNLTSFLHQFYLILTSCLPLFNLNLTSASSGISNHGLETTVYTRLGFGWIKKAHRNQTNLLISSDCDAHREPQKSLAISEKYKAMPHWDLRVRWKIASELRFRVVISEPTLLLLNGSNKVRGL